MPTSDTTPAAPSAAPASDAVSLKQMAGAIRALSMDAVEAAQSGHPGMPMGMADVASVLFTKHLKFDAATPNWPDRDRFVLSAGHGSMLLYSLLHLTGYQDMTLEEIKNFRQSGSKTAGHPEYGHATGIETTTGPLGQGLGNAVGMALAERMLNARFGDKLVDHHTYVIAGDGCLMEGISHEAISMAGHLGLGKLILLFDDNGISIDGKTDLTVSDDQAARFKACGWHVQAVDGHDPDAIDKAIRAAKRAKKPSMIACKTVIGFGAPKKAGTAGAHGAPLGAEEIAAVRDAIDWPYAPFEIPDDILGAWRAAGSRGAKDQAKWAKRLAGADGDLRATFTRGQKGELPDGWEGALSAYLRKTSEDAPKMATRVASQKALEVLCEAVPEMIGGSADLTGSNNTKAGDMGIVNRDDFSGRYIHYGVREHGMAAAMNGMALHGGMIPYGGTFMVFTDYCRPSIRLAALMGQRVVYVMTHDSIGLGEDGPTHQPVEHLSALRVIPNLTVFRPCDAVETAECWGLSLANDSGPSLLALTRQGLPTLRTIAQDDNLSARGGYVMLEAQGGPRRAMIVASGSEVEIACQAREALQADGVPTAVVSMPSQELFKQQTAAYREGVLGGATVAKVAVEAATGESWATILGGDFSFIGMTGFGASAPYQELYAQFGITPQAVADAVRKRLA